MKTVPISYLEAKFEMYQVKLQFLTEERNIHEVQLLLNRSKYNENLWKKSDKKVKRVLDNIINVRAGINFFYHYIRLTKNADSPKNTRLLDRCKTLIRKCRALNEDPYR